MGIKCPNCYSSALHKLNQAEHTNLNPLSSKDPIYFVRLWVQISHEAITLKHKQCNCFLFFNNRIFNDFFRNFIIHGVYVFAAARNGFHQQNIFNTVIVIRMFLSP